MENQTISTSEPAVQPQTLSQQPMQLLNAQQLNSALGQNPIVGVQQETPNSPMQFMMRWVDRLIPSSQQPSTQSNPYQAQQVSSTTSPTVQIPQYDARHTAAPIYDARSVNAAPVQTQNEPEQNYWAGNEDLTQFLEENGVSSIQDLLQYTAGQEQSAEQMQEIFQYAMHPDPEIRQEFWNNYEQALAEQGLIEQPQQQQYQAPSLPGTPQNYGYSSYQQPGFSNPEQFAQQHALMNSGLPNITPQALAEFDRAVMMTDGRFWGQNAFMFGDL